MTDEFRVGFLQRLALGTSYVQVVEHVRRLVQQLPGCELVIDFGGVGRPVFDMFINSGLSAIGLLLTAGTAETMDGHIHHVPKIVLVSRLQALLHQGKLKIHKDLTEAEALVRELQDFRLQYTGSSMTFNARSGRHDDLVLALALACWRAADGGMKDAGLYYLAAARAGAFAPSRTVIGLDLGQANDPSAIAIVQRIHDPIRPIPAVEVAQPESTANPPSIDEQLVDQDLQTKLALGSISSGGPLAIKPIPQAHNYQYVLQPGSAEYQRFRDEELRFAAMLNGRDPLPSEMSAHENRLKEIRDAYLGV
jgi:hypothetical protein